MNHKWILAFMEETKNNNNKRVIVRYFQCRFMLANSFLSGIIWTVFQLFFLKKLGFVAGDLGYPEETGFYYFC